MCLTYKKCICIERPAGRHGLEGYNRDEIYKCQLVKKEGKEHYRVFPDNKSYYYETCSVQVFNKYFRKEVKHNDK